MHLYGTDTETFCVLADGSIWLVQSPDLVGEYQQLLALPAAAEPLDVSVANDLVISTYLEQRDASAAAAALGRKGGRAGTGAAKRRSTEHYRRAGAKGGRAKAT